MQKIVVTYLASLLLFQGVFLNTDILFEVDELLEDYQLHKVKYGDNLTTFISKHFGELKESHKNQHQEEHQQHKHPTQDKIGNSNQVDFTVNHIRFLIKNIIEVNNLKSNFHYTDLFSSFEKQKIFQPPRFS